MMKSNLWRHLWLFTCCVLVLCQCNRKPAPDIPSKTNAEELSGAEPDDGDFVGLTLEKGGNLAEERELVHRVTSIDGKPQPVTSDLRPDRVNFELEDDRIVKVTRG